MGLRWWGREFVCFPLHVPTTSPPYHHPQRLLEGELAAKDRVRDIVGVDQPCRTGGELDRLLRAIALEGVVLLQEVVELLHEAVVDRWHLFQLSGQAEWGRGQSSQEPREP